MSNFRPKTTNPRIFFHLCQCDGRIIFPFASRCKGLGPLLALYVWAVGFWFDFDFEIVADTDAVDSGLKDAECGHWQWTWAYLCLNYLWNVPRIWSTIVVHAM